MTNYILQVIGLFGSYVSFIGLAISIKPDLNFSINYWIWLIITSVIVGVAFLLITKQYWSCRPKIFKQKDEINKYMYNWIENGDRVAICTRDMSWASSPEIKTMLFKKAKNKELCICLPKQTELTRELEETGADIYTYPELEHTPNSRFTIIHKDTHYARVAVGRTIENNVHEIEEFSIGSHPVFSVANDLVEIIIKYHSKGKKD